MEPGKQEFLAFEVYRMPIISMTASAWLLHVVLAVTESSK